MATRDSRTSFAAPERAMIDGEWVDVPPGRMQQAGQLVLTVVSAQGEPILQRARKVVDLVDGRGGGAAHPVRRRRHPVRPRKPPNPSGWLSGPFCRMARSRFGTPMARSNSGHGGDHDNLSGRTSASETRFHRCARAGTAAHAHGPGPVATVAGISQQAIVAIISTMVASDPAALQALRDRKARRACISRSTCGHR